MTDKQIRTNLCFPPPTYFTLSQCNIKGYKVKVSRQKKKNKLPMYFNVVEDGLVDV